MVRQLGWSGSAIRCGHCEPAASPSQQLLYLRCSASQQLESLRQRYKEGSHTLAKSSSATSLGAAEAEGAGLMQRVLALKSARDRLIAALDLQASEVERLSAENASLAQVHASTYLLLCPSAAQSIG